jgi:hypothetical protein
MLGSPTLSGKVTVVPEGPITVRMQFFLYSSSLACFSCKKMNRKDQFTAAYLEMELL